jgi:FdhD protein
MEMAGMERFPILCVTEEGKSEIEDMLAREGSLTIILNEHQLATLFCTPSNLDYLAVGFIASEGLLRSKDEIKRITVDDKNGMVWVETIDDKRQPAETLPKRVIASSGGRGLASVTHWRKVESQMNISTHDVFGLVEKFQHRSPIFRATGGTHLAALCDTSDILISAEDIGRHNALDKVLGECILKDVPTDDRIVITSGRVSSEILLKVARRRIPMTISISAPTDLAVRLASDWGITLIGFARGKRMNVYAHSWRVVAP